MSGIHGHRRGLAHAGCLPGWWLLRGASSHQVVERWSALNEGVQSFLYTWVVKIDTWSRAGRSLTAWCKWHAARRWWGTITLGSRWRKARHGWAGWVLGRGAVGLRLRGDRQASSACWRPCATVEQAEDFSLQLLLMIGVSRDAWTRWQAEVAGLWGCVSRMGWSRQSCSCGRNIMVGCCRNRRMDCSCKRVCSAS